MWRFLSVLILVAVPVWGANIFVDPNNPEGFATISEAVQEADEGDVIFVAEGFYSEQITIDKNLSLIGAGAELTTISFAQAGNTIDMTADVDTTTHIDGFSITAKGGIGIAIADGGSATILNCTFSRCAQQGVSLSSSESIVRLNLFTGNQGGALYAYLDQGSVITNNTFKENASGAGDGWQGWLGTVFFRNEATRTVFANNLLKGNTATGAIHCWGSSPTIKNNVIVENADRGIIIMSATSGATAAPLISSNIIADNNIGIHLTDGTPVITYNDVYNSASGDYNGASDDVGGISKDPKFTDTRREDYSLMEGSPCIDTGMPGAANSDPDDTRNDMGMFGGPFANLWDPPYIGPVVTNLEVNPSRVQQGGTINVRASGTTVRE